MTLTELGNRYRKEILGINTAIWAAVAGIGLAGWADCGCLSLLFAGLTGVIVSSASCYELYD